MLKIIWLYFFVDTVYMYVICLIDESESNYYYYYRNADCTNRTYLCGEIIIISALISDQ